MNQASSKCIWCSSSFTPRAEGKNHYVLESAGVAICWKCSDLYQDAEIKLRIGSIRAKVNGLVSKITTESGHELSLTLESWQDSRVPWRRSYGRARDKAGKLWSVRGEEYATLKPIGV